MTEDLRVWVHSRHPKGLKTRLSPHQPIHGEGDLVLYFERPDSKMGHICTHRFVPVSELKPGSGGWRQTVAQLIKECRKELRNA